MISVITGGQTGVDTGAAQAALAVLGAGHVICYMPKGMKREKPAPKWLLEISSALECASYQDRTKAVIKKALATLVIQPEGDDTPGTGLTLRESMDVGNQMWRFMNIGDKAKWKAESHAIAYWLHSLMHLYGDFHLMVAGPREGKWEQGDGNANVIMTHVLTELKGLRK